MPNLPEEQPVHTIDVIADATAPYAPVEHEVHADVPVASALYAPATQAVHAAEVLARVTLPYRPAAHEVQARVPVDRELNEPAAHAVQLEVPVIRSLYEPATQAVQAKDVLAAATLPYLPAEHPVHTDEPVVNEL